MQVRREHPYPRNNIPTSPTSTEPMRDLWMLETSFRGEGRDSSPRSRKICTACAPDINIVTPRCHFLGTFSLLCEIERAYENTETWRCAKHGRLTNRSMKSKTPLCAVRTHRRRWALTQREVATLLGFESRTSVSRIEQGKHVPNLETALALEVVFGVAPREMFPSIFGEIEEQVMRQSLELYEATLQSSKPRERRKRELLEVALKRATSRRGV